MTLRDFFHEHPKAETAFDPVRYEISEGFGVCRAKLKHDDLGALSLTELHAKLPPRRGRRQMTKARVQILDACFFPCGGAESAV